MLKADENLALEYSKMVETKDREAILDFLKTHGVSDEDIKNQELSDDELDRVVGGGKFMDWWQAGVDRRSAQSDKELAHYLETGDLPSGRHFF